MVFDRLGVPHPASPITGCDTIVQIVPDPGSWFPEQFALSCHSEGWVEPEIALQEMEVWRASNWGVNIHSRRPGVQVSGIGRGRPRFLRGGGFSLFIGAEIGLLPDGVIVDGIRLTQMVVVFGVTIPDSGVLPTFSDAALHIVPAEYLRDPEYPNPLLPPVAFDDDFHLPPPPIFRPGRASSLYPGYTTAEVHLSLSAFEAGEPYSLDLACVLVRGPSYRRLFGLPTL